MRSAEEFAASVARSFGDAWRVESTSAGFAAILGLDGGDEFRLDVTVDEPTGVFSFTGGRSASFSRDVTTTGLGHYERRVEKGSYRGAHRSWTFSRTPDGIVPDASDPRNTSAREEELVRIGTGLGLTLDLTQRPPAAAPDGRRMIVLVAVAFGVVVLLVGGVFAAILVAAASALR